MPVVFAVLFLISFQSRAEEIPASPETLFEKLDGPIRLQGIVEMPIYWFYLGAPNIKGVAYLPSFATRVGPRLLWKDLGLTATFALPIPSSEQYRRGTSSQTELIFNSYWRQNAIDIYYQSFRSFYVTSPFRELSFHKPARYPQLPDAFVTNFGFNWYYVFQPETFSLKAAFDQTEFQLKSGGSWMISPFYNHLDMALGTRFIPGIGDESIRAVPNLASGRFDSVGTSVGYGYSYIDGRFFASAQGALGPGVQYQQLHRADGNDSNYFGFLVKINLNLAMGWNYRQYVGGIKLLLDSLSSEISGTKVASNMASAQMFFGARF